MKNFSLVFVILISSLIIGINLKKCQEENKCPENIDAKINQKSSTKNSSPQTKDNLQ